jgi:hypothetical protein
MEVNKWLPSFVGMKRKPEKKKGKSEGHTEHRNEVGVRPFGRTSTRERKTMAISSRYWTRTLILPEERVTAHGNGKEAFRF